MGLPEIETRLDMNYHGLDNVNNYTGYSFDEVLDIYYAQARFYDPAERRFIQQDPIKSGDNWYVYCRNNPITLVDPLGLAGAATSLISQGLQNLITGVSLNQSYDGYKISVWASDLAVEYASDRGYLDESGAIRTWDNEADAFRHFIWNARMTQDISSKAARAIGTNHEYFDYQRISGGYVMFVALNSYMDLHNNQLGRNYGMRLSCFKIVPDSTYEELFRLALNDDLVITSLDAVYSFYPDLKRENETVYKVGGSEYRGIFSKYDYNKKLTGYIKGDEAERLIEEYRTISQRWK